MIKYFELYGNIYKIIDNKLYRYDDKLKDWKCCTYFSRQHLLKEYGHTQLTLLDIVMMGLPE